MNKTKLEQEEARQEIRKYADAYGMCHDCKEYTEVLNPCCGARVEFEGHSTSYEDFDEIELESYLNGEWK